MSNCRNMQISAFLLCHGGIFQQKPGVEEGGGLYKKSGIAPYFLELLVSLSNLNIAVAVYILEGCRRYKAFLGTHSWELAYYALAMLR